MKSFIPSETAPAGPEDGPEEGEIVSDDLEDISDESIIFTPCNGKSLSRSDHSHALSLSSVTDLEDFSLEKRRKRKKSYSQRHAKRRKHGRRKLVDSDSSDDDTTLDRRLKLQLKAAVRVDVEEAHRNSLRTRLRAMVQSASGPESDIGTTELKLKENGFNTIIGSSDVLCLPEKDASIIEIDSGTDSVVSASEVIPNTTEIVSATEVVLSAPENMGLEQQRDDIDSELIQLRIEALKTAINNKFANRKRRKKDNINGTSLDDTNKENTNNNNGEAEDNRSEKKIEIPQISPQSSNEPENNALLSPEEDEDVLRALLLASMSKKITSIETEPIKVAVPAVLANPIVVNFNKIALNKKISNINAFKLNNVKKVVNNVRKVVNKASGNTKLVKMPQVKPLIISVNSDSDSDLDLSSSPDKSPQKLQKTSVENTVIKNLEAAIESSVDRFLREQRAKVESELQTVCRPCLEKGKSVVETKKEITTTKGTVVNSEIAGGSTIISKNTQYSKNITSNTNKITSSTNKSTTNTNKNIQMTNSTTENNKNLKLVNLEKSALKFLPENKREEYQQLQNLLKLRRAQLKKPRARRISQKVTDSNNPKNLVNKNELAANKNRLIIKNTSQVINKVASVHKVDGPQIFLPNKNAPTTPVVPKGKQNKTKLVNKTANNENTRKMENLSQFSKVDARNQERINQQLRAETCNQERNSDAFLLHTTLKEMQTRKDGRLQIQERYKSLRPLIKIINDVSKEQKHWDQEVKRLLDQLADARKKQQEGHRNMSAFVKELVDKKQKMDESLAKISNKPKINQPITSTPLKQNISETSLDISAVDGPPPSLSPGTSGTGQKSNINPEDTLVNKNKDDSKETDKSSKRNDESKNMLNTWEQSTKVNNIAVEVADVKRVISDTELNVVDPNDIDKIIRKTEEKVAVLEKKESFECRRSKKVRYVSPLDSVKRKEEFDPFAIMCPFEVNGMCKDSECTFKHLPK